VRVDPYARKLTVAQSTTTHVYLFVKRTFDITISLSGLVASSPLIAFIALLIKWDSRGPVFYVGTRIGRFGKPFRLIKLRTMVVDADKVGASSTPDDDPRITMVGRLLRRYKLDELPQLINILKGEMSFVGPRPQVSWVVKLYSESDKKVLSVRPGIADYAFVMLPSEGEVLRSSTDPDGDYLTKIHPEKMRLSLEYVNSCSFWIDLKILADTALLSFFRQTLFLQRLEDDSPSAKTNHPS